MTPRAMVNMVQFSNKVTINGLDFKIFSFHDQVNTHGCCMQLEYKSNFSKIFTIDTFQQNVLDSMCFIFVILPKLEKIMFSIQFFKKGFKHRQWCTVWNGDNNLLSHKIKSINPMDLIVFMNFITRLFAFSPKTSQNLSHTTITIVKFTTSLLRTLTFSSCIVYLVGQSFHLKKGKKCVS